MDPISKSLQLDVSCPIKSRFKNQNLERRRNSRVKKKKNAVDHSIIELERILEEDDEYIISQRNDAIKPLG